MLRDKYSTKRNQINVETSKFCNFNLSNDVIHDAHKVICNGNPNKIWRYSLLANDFESNFPSFKFYFVEYLTVNQGFLIFPKFMIFLSKKVDPRDFPFCGSLKSKSYNSDDSTSITKIFKRMMRYASS
jgi:hypothetical protein